MRSNPSLTYLAVTLGGFDSAAAVVVPKKRSKQGGCHGCFAFAYLLVVAVLFDGFLMAVVCGDEKA